MITDLINFAVILAFIASGFSRPHIALCLVLWVDLYKPQETSFSFLSGLPLSLISASFFFLSVAINFKKISARSYGPFISLTIALMFWVTYTTFNSPFAVAWIKYDTVIKTLLIVLMMPLVIDEKKKFEQVFDVIVITFSSFILAAGTKSLLGGGGYGIALVGTGGLMWSEGSYLANQAVSFLPIYIYMYKHSSLFKVSKYAKYVPLFLCVCALATLVGTQARSGLVCLAVFLFLLLKTSKGRLALILVALPAALVLPNLLPDDFKDRMASIEQAKDGQESSAQGRIVVWRWTLDYVSENPLGGGFYAYLHNAGKLHEYARGNEVVIQNKGGKAYHSIFFELLAEHGYPGTVGYLSLLGLAYLRNRRTNTKLSVAMNQSMLIYMAGGMFINIAFYPYILYMIALSFALNKVQK